MLIAPFADIRWIHLVCIERMCTDFFSSNTHLEQIISDEDLFHLCGISYRFQCQQIYDKPIKMQKEILNFTEFGYSIGESG